MTLRILIVDDEATARYGMAKALRTSDREILEADSGDSALELIQTKLPHLVFLDLNMPRKNGLSVLKELQTSPQTTKPEIIVVTANDTLDQAVECIRQGAGDFISKPFDVDHLRAIARRSQERVALEEAVVRMESQAEASAGLGAIWGVSRPMQELFENIRRAARSHLPILIRGESGTGKELIAKELHLQSDRAFKAYVPVNTAAISEALIESELFGHVKGAFTGADRERAGVFQQADGGTLFLDEIGDMPVGVQTRLLRVLQEGIVQPVGSSERIHVDVRIISATHQDLENAIQEKLFREDLYYRLRGIELSVPALRARQEDILFLAKRFLGSKKHLSNEAVRSLLEYTWPGNVRELKQRIESALAMSSSDVLSPSDVGLSKSGRTTERGRFDEYFDMPLTEAKARLSEEFERQAIQRAIELESGNISAAARRLGIHRQSLQQKIKHLEEDGGAA